MQEALGYLEGTVQGKYLELLPSRWAALLPRMAKRTQRLQTLAHIAAQFTLERELEEDFELATQLLVMEHELYREGVSIFHAAFTTADDPVRRTWELLARDVLAELTSKEMMLAHWKAAVSTIPSDTLRVYSYALLVHARVSKARVQNLAELIAAGA
ncbi:hypothetical protein ABB37_09561 [Leptomonas pyrrhocoris]|uniref:Uncharacterized protein n=1 Tax=Leptomonas pyrrhocoris TaxID=157538 RepID=A0A0M9FQF9_LEPPY|nr:hypothetical protein ABB37_09561 [Leptomonas pyrrhocoris]KPA73990.1 hypothetical protein ABB37_09561 [Leptomonas pyrrhocoris]|eukprot:XP_015652429.1 hypothetical protein ABB37_09561 [Leptomonas pyrrhocoris]